ncbi:tetratricopeptide repeat protein 19 homolog, mitochondrial-like [Zerene cesonia]|uniref:tetratricopeptide repeat protein 19 homolog, mitochondrial-like n=1 Tax=Zerene cesonia TaxID=33412 RepID=UPI0018E4EBBD|nr:tetratricopeptide repeat protein 19 homolog, mitochondrial-like [Zerene cesonia]
MSSRYRFFLRRLYQVKFAHRFNISNVSILKIPHKIGLPCTLGFSILTLIGLEKKLSAEDELILMIKHCVLFIQRNENAKAEQLLHVALRQAQQMNHESGITYIYDVMANLALQRERLDEAKKLFVAVAQRLMASGAKDDDLRVVQVSVKLARVSHLQKDYTTAQLGYDWCLEKIREAYNSNPSQELTKLFAMAEDWYGRLFIDCNQYDNGFNYMLSAYNKMKELKDVDPEHIVVQLNDLGTVCDQMNRVDDCINYLSQAIDIGKTLPEMEDLGAMYVNLGRAYIRKKMLDTARRYCGHAYKLGVAKKNNDIKQEAAQCMNEIKNVV